jgi:hypothetical protein
MSLPPEDQPETGQPKELPANLKKQLVATKDRLRWLSREHLVAVDP